VQSNKKQKDQYSHLTAGEREQIVLKDKEIADFELKLEQVLINARQSQSDLKESVAGDKSDGTLSKLVRVKMDLEDEEKHKADKKKEIEFWYSMDRFN